VLSLLIWPSYLRQAVAIGASNSSVARENE